MKKQDSESTFRRVTQILGMYKDFSSIPPTVISKGVCYTREEVLEKAADRGTRAHRLCELHAKSMLFEPIPDDCKPYVESFQRWFDSAIESVLHTEQRLYCKTHMITGQVDLIAKIKGSDAFTIIDIKTPQTECPTWRLQTAGYRHLVNEELRLFGTNRACLMLSAKGGDAKLVYHTEHLKDNELFFSALKLYNYFNPRK